MTDIEDKNIIYIVKEAEQVRNGENIYKIGMTRKGMYKRLQGYRKGTEPMFFLDIGKIDCGYFEKRVIKRFKTLFIQRFEFGNEYFQGSFNQMIFSVTNEFMLMNISVSDANNELVEEDEKNIITEDKSVDENESMLIEDKFFVDENENMLIEDKSVDENENMLIEDKISKDFRESCYLNDWYKNTKKIIEKEYFFSFPFVYKINESGIDKLTQKTAKDILCPYQYTFRKKNYVFFKLWLNDPDRLNLDIIHDINKSSGVCYVTKTYNLYDTLDLFVRDCFLEKQDSWVTLKQIKEFINKDEAYKNKIHTGNGFRDRLVYSLKTPCIDQTSVNGKNYKNVFKGWMVKENLHCSTCNYYYINKFLDNFKITDKVDDYITSLSIKIWLDENEIGITQTKFGIELKKYCKQNSFLKVENKRKKIQGNNLMCWFGIRLK